MSLQIANGDIKMRETNVTRFSDISVSSEDTDRYHAPAFENAGLDADAYLPRTLQKVTGGFWSLYTGSPTKDISGEAF